ncbi:hypothetical protein MBCUT_04660 [Methanobrevibacter cuticularis]|uniref:Damage-control phosphatase ARMT1-like metal-binding domain-containing protein n=1 Tax=Methanobrevibacter cuticularis TaxID=47311 RepID=A0A166EQY7_9EURY|nr:ARMT1-like domain-containing protein [Methanobrevibacter cuticularis]KZX16915.1 hypothetical protein MBCUT_04660 [Methanobrevibacter cuticularis]
MKVYYECGACFLRQAREAMDLATDDVDIKITLMQSIFEYLADNYNTEASSNKVGTDIHRMIKSKTNCEDPYIKEKRLGNQIAMDLLPKFQKILSKDASLENYTKIAIIGNILDFGALGLDIDLEALIRNSLKKKLVINETKKLEKSLNNVDSLLYLVDNTGEIVFDKLLIEKLKKEYGVDITVAVKSKPIINDACLEDALSIGLDEIANVVTIGADSVGIIYEYSSPAFQKIFNSHDLVISKGLGNYEGLTELSPELQNKDVYCLLSAKCSAIAKDIGLDEGDMATFRLFSKS